MISTTDAQRTHALILAGGQGERLLPLTVSRPKPAIPFGAGFRIIDFTLSNCLNSKVGQVALLTQYRHEDLHEYIRTNWSPVWSAAGNGSRPLVCLPPTSGKRYRGTADAVFQNLPIIESTGSENVLILSGDHVYEMDYRDLLAHHVETRADVTIATVEHPVHDASHFGVVEVETDFRVIGFQEKPVTPRGLPRRPHAALISMGVYAFKRDFLVQTLMDNCDSGFRYDFGHHIIPSLIHSARVYAYDFRNETNDGPRFWRDIGTIDSYYEASLQMIQPGVVFNSLSVSQLSPAGPRPRVSGSAKVKQSVLSPGVRIEQDAFIEDSVLMPGVVVGKGASLRRAIVEGGVHVPAGFRAGWDIEQDRSHHTVSPAGVVVITGTQRTTKRTAMRATLRSVEARAVIGNVAKAVLEYRAVKCQTARSVWRIGSHG